MESTQYAAPQPRPSLARAGSTLAPALVLCAVAGVAGQVHRVYSSPLAGYYVNDPSGQGGVEPLSLRLGVLIADPTTSVLALAPAVAVVALTGLHLLATRSAPV
ncbi:MAG: hypothetical protein M3Y71_01820, partial [Actinomycetota bacterium]|nr:hypothetical protein [Actinomycetota bacterium]